jgi:drug/metabolite transporter (DMT)-like permease
MKHIKAATASTIITLNPILTIIIMIFLTNAEVSWIEAEKLSITSGIGAVLVILGAIGVVKG